MRYLFLTFIFCLYLSTNLQAQVLESFTDNDYVNDPAWTASSDALWQINNGQLQSNSAGAATYYISTTSSLAENASWEFFINLKFATSGVNYVDVFLTADNPDLAQAKNGYFIRIGDTQDEIVLYKLINGAIISLIDYAEGVVNSTSNNPFFIKVTRNADNLWTLAYREGQTGTLTTVGSITDNAFNSSTAFGFLVQQSSAAGPVENHFFDDIIVAEIGADHTPPSLLDVDVLANNQLALIFSEPLEKTAAENVANYQFNNGIGQPFSATLVSNKTKVTLITEVPFAHATTYELTVENIQDLAANTLATTTRSFLYFEYQQPAWKDVILSEIFPDPTPPNDLPDAEFVELYNRSDVIFQLKNWSFGDGATSSLLPEQFLAPGEYLILCDMADTSAFKKYGKVAGLYFPTLNNHGDVLVLKDDTGQLIDSLNYTSEWYKDDTKSGGGWTLELINTENTCGESENWMVSSHASGGTPGTTNAVNDPYFDTSAPILMKVTVENTQSIHLHFDERIDPASISAANFMIDQSIEIDQARHITPGVVELVLGDTLPFDEVLYISISGLSDCSGNVITEPQQKPFVQVSIKPVNYKDVIITEIMADPSPVNDLPEAEYVEIFNRSDKILDLAGWRLADQATISNPISQFALFPDSYVILCEEANTEIFQKFGSTIGLTDWPSLNNGGDRIRLLGSDSLEVDTIHYERHWHINSSKKEGGWSLELIDTENICGDHRNWTTSENEAGGTPGEVNAVIAQQPDLKGPMLKKVLAFRPDSLVLVFNENLDRSSIPTGIFQIEPMIEVQNVEAINLQAIALHTAHLEKGKTYSITVKNLLDCTGNMIDEDQKPVSFGVLAPADPGDIIINEVLFNPYTGGVDFVELYNRSGKYINLETWSLATAEPFIDSLVIKQLRHITSEPYIIRPEDYVALTPDPMVLKEHYPLAIFSKLLSVNSMPNLTDESSRVVIYDQNGLKMDQLDYHEDYHSALLDRVEGVSLERIFPGKPTQQPDNWASAAAPVGYATPGYKNSQMSSQIQFTSGDIFVSPKVIIPDGSGQQDFTTISYQFDKTGFVGTVKIFDIQGRLVKDIASNQFLSKEGIFTWDGSDNHRQMQGVGYYIIWFEVFDDQGHAKIFKEKVVVGTRF